MHVLYLRTLLLQSRMQADSVVLPTSNVAQTTQTLTLYRRNYFIKKKNWKGDFYEVMGMRNVTN